MTRCIKCGRTLSDPKSIKLGIGPICRKNGSLKQNKLDAILDNYDPLEYINLTPEESKPFKELFTRHKDCSCGYKNLHSLQIIGYYPHDEGCIIRGKKNWLYIKCPKCNNDMSLWKFGAEFRKTELKKDSNGRYFLEDLK